MTTPLEYKGYQANVEYQDGTLVIEVLHVQDHLVAECKDASEVEMEFRALIDEYIADCVEIGKDPEKPFKGIFNVRVKPELHRQCAKAAAAHGIALNEFVGRALDEYVQRVGFATTSAYEVVWAEYSSKSEVGIHVHAAPARGMKLAERVVEKETVIEKTESAWVKAERRH